MIPILAALSQRKLTLAALSVRGGSEASLEQKLVGLASQTSLRELYRREGGNESTVVRQFQGLALPASRIGWIDG